MGRTACTEPQCLYKGALYPYLSHCDRYLQERPANRPTITGAVLKTFDLTFTYKYVLE